MSFRPELIPWLLALTLASFACRAAGFWLMRFVTMTPRLAAAQRAAPLCVMVGLVVPTAMQGRLAESVGLAAVILIARLTGSDLTAALAGVAAVAIVRAV
jgi:uncharacterized membrane protein